MCVYIYKNKYVFMTNYLDMEFYGSVYFSDVTNFLI